MDPSKVVVQHDREGDILNIHLRPPYLGQHTDELELGVFARSNPETGAVESLEIMGWSRRDRLEVPAVVQFEEDESEAVLEAVGGA